MSISLPTWTRREIPLLGRWHRVWAVTGAGLRRESRRPAALFAIGVGSVITIVTSLIFVLLAPLLNPGQSLDLSFFYTPAANFTNLAFIILMTAVVGSGLIADDLDTMALSLYLSRPLSTADYLTAKAAILAPLIGLIAILPLVLTPFLGALLGSFAWDVALEAMGLSFLLGLFFTAFFTALGLFLSSLTRRRAYAAAAVFALTLGLTGPAELLAGPSTVNNPALLYLSPWDNYLAVARAAFGVSGGPIDWIVSLGILLGVTILAAVATYTRMRAMEVVSG